ncbi:GNAT family N-acetyltransferase [Cellulomonas sp. McL0617]|uniref:GNAT family N-acetyltransferase n=1 Tax=Cellulomonas sp. McL0617 TaxID=3415675 RepID=UPI003CEF9AFB
MTDIMVDAFFDDPTWGWAFPDPARRRDQHRAMWSLFIEGAARYPWTWLADGGTAAAVWIPPGGTESTPEQGARIEALVGNLPEPDRARVSAAFALIEDAHGDLTEPHYYLSFLGTDPQSRGHGFGLGLLADNLRLIDEERMPAYLESSNPANVALYRRHGFEVVTRFVVEPGGPEVTTMWRDSV